MASPVAGGKKVLLFQSPNASLAESDPLPDNALLNTDTGTKAELYRKTLLADMLNDLRGVANSLDEDGWKFEKENGFLG